MGKFKRKKKRKKNGKKEKDNQNLFTIAIAIIIVIALIFVYIIWRKKTPKPSDVIEKEPSIDPLYIRLAELEKERDDLQFKKYILYRKLCEFKVIERWCKEKIDVIFKCGRWGLFLLVLSGFIITWLKPDFLGLSTTGFLKGINAVGILIFLLYFASSDENDSLMKCYHNSKPAAVSIFMKLIYWHYEKFHKIHKDNKEKLKEDLHSIFLKLKPVMDEIRDLKNSLSKDPPNTTNLLN